MYIVNSCLDWATCNISWPVLYSRETRIRIKCTALLALCFWSIQVYDVLRGLSPDAKSRHVLKQGPEFSSGQSKPTNPKSSEDSSSEGMSFMHTLAIFHFT